MKLDTPSMQSWQLILLIQLLVDIIIVLDVPIARQILGFLYLTYIPGFIALRLLRFKKLDMTQVLLFSIGFSVAIVMFLGVLVNTLFPLLGVQNPLSNLPLMVTLNFLTVGFCVVDYFYKKDFSLSFRIQKPSPWILFFLSLPFLSVTGTLIVNSGGSNLVSLLLPVMICALILACTSLGRKKFSSNFYIFMLFAIAISLFLQYSLITNYITGNDIYKEFYVFSRTNNASYWDSSSPSSEINIGKTNAMLSVTILPTIYSQILNMDGNMVFKFLYPFILSWLVVVLFKLYHTQLSEKISFLSALFFTTNSVVFMLFSNRQIIAEFFYVLLFYILLEKKLGQAKRRICYLFFGVALVVSHYSIAYILLLSISLIWLFNLLLKRIEKDIKISQILYLLVSSFVWYIFVSGSASFNSLLDTSNYIYKNLYSDFFDVAARDSLVVSALGGGEVYSLWHQIGRIFFYISELLIVVGFITLIVNRQKGRGLNQTFEKLISINLAIVLACIVLPNFSSALQITRFYQIAILPLAPLCIIGGKATIVLLIKKNGKAFYASLLLVLFLIPFFLFQSGFIYAIAGVKNWSIPLDINNCEFENPELYSRIVYEQEVIAAQWLSQKTSTNSQTFKHFIYADALYYDHVLTSYGMFIPENMRILNNITLPEEGSYIYLGRQNTLRGVVRGTTYDWDISDVSSFLVRMDKVYSNGESEIYVDSSQKP